MLGCEYHLVTSVQLILSFSLTASLTIFVQNPWSRLCCIHLFEFVIITLHYSIAHNSPMVKVPNFVIFCKC